jgi:hypothetical protein
MSSDQPQPDQPQPDQPQPDQPPVDNAGPIGSMWDEPQAVEVVATPRVSSNSIVALVLSITSWVVCPIVFAVVALVFANKAEKEIAASNGSVGGGAFVSASKIVAWINIGVYTAVVILGILALFFLTIFGVSGN